MLESYCENAVQIAKTEKLIWTSLVTDPALTAIPKWRRNSFGWCTHGAFAICAVTDRRHRKKMGSHDCYVFLGNRELVSVVSEMPTVKRELRV
jgi:hypothetical protein